MKRSHQKLCTLAEEAIDEVFSDMTVSQEQTLGSLRELRSIIEFKINAIKKDLGLPIE